MKIINAVINVATMSTGGVILRLVLLLVGGLAAFFIAQWIKKKVAEQAHKNTEAQREKDQAGVEPDNRTVFDGAEKDQQDIEDIIKNRKKDE